MMPESPSRMAERDVLEGVSVDTPVEELTDEQIKAIIDLLRELFEEEFGQGDIAPATEDGERVTEISDEQG